jgi:hypothetical protein
MGRVWYWRAAPVHSFNQELGIKCVPGFNRCWRHSYKKVIGRRTEFKEQFTLPWWDEMERREHASQKCKDSQIFTLFASL